MSLTHHRKRDALARAPVPTAGLQYSLGEEPMTLILLWLPGMPLGIIVLLFLVGVGVTGRTAAGAFRRAPE